MTISEVPTGVIADLLGKKGSLITSFFLQALGGFMMAFAPHFSWLVISVAIMGIGASFYSGTLEALTYDSLKQEGKEDKYPKIISNIRTISLITPAICGIIGGFLYIIRPNLPFLVNSVGYTIAIFLAFLLIEPKFETEKFSIKSFLNQTKYGLSFLFKKGVTGQTILLLSVGVIFVICAEMLNSFLGVELGFNPESLAILWSLIFLVSAFASQLTPKLIHLLSYRNSVILLGVLIALSLLVSPYLGMLLGGIMLIFRVSLESIFSNLTSIIINQTTESAYRATTLSTFNLLQNIPYVLTAYYLGSLADHYSAINVAVFLGVTLITLIFIQLFTTKKFVIER